MLNKLMEQLEQYNEKIDKKKKELADLEEKKKTTENKIFSTVMCENNLGIADVVDLIQTYKIDTDSNASPNETSKPVSSI